MLAGSIKMAVFWVVALFMLVEVQDILELLPTSIIFAFAP
jgi:hypothetical protein